jgi:hypothetical protein
MRDIWSYGIAFPYGYSVAYGSTFHTGEDWTVTDFRTDIPVTVNGVTIGIAGSTGKSTGIHCHVGKWLGGQHYPPNGAGKQFDSAVVTEVHPQDTDDNGKYVRIQADGYSYVYLHLSSILVTKGQALKGGNVATNALTKEEIAAIYQLAFDNNDYPMDIINAYTGKPLGGLLQQLQADPSYLAHKQAVNNPVTTGFKKVEVYVPES